MKLIYTVCCVSCIAPFLSIPTATTLVVFRSGDLQSTPYPRKSAILPYFLTPAVVMQLKVVSFSTPYTHSARLFFKYHFEMSPPPQKSFITHYCHASNMLNLHSKPLCSQIELLSYSSCYSPSESCSIQTGQFPSLSHSACCPHTSQSRMSFPPTCL